MYVQSTDLDYIPNLTHVGLIRLSFTCNGLVTFQHDKVGLG